MREEKPPNLKDEHSMNIEAELLSLPGDLQNSKNKSTNFFTDLSQLSWTQKFLVRNSSLLFLQSISHRQTHVLLRFKESSCQWTMTLTQSWNSFWRNSRNSIFKSVQLESRCQTTKWKTFITNTWRNRKTLRERFGTREKRSSSNKKWSIDNYKRSITTKSSLKTSYGESTRDSTSTLVWRKRDNRWDNTKNKDRLKKKRRISSNLTSTNHSQEFDQSLQTYSNDYRMMLTRDLLG